MTTGSCVTLDLSSTNGSLNQSMVVLSNYSQSLLDFWQQLLPIIIRIQKLQKFNISFQISMEQLNRLIKDASNQFECHNFQTSLSLYTRCIDRCVEEKLPKYVLNNLKSSVAALKTILGDYPAALEILNDVLTEDKQHWLSLIRRSQVYKKQSKYKKAMKDLEVLGMYAPDNMQVVALKLELKGLMSKPNESSSESQEEQNQVNEEEFLNFSNLKKIDRCSVSIMLPKSRQSRVTISGDTSFFYEANNDNKQKIRLSKAFTPSFNCQRFIDIDKQLEETIPSQKQVAPIIIKAKPTRSKSILKNRQSKSYVSDKLDPDTHEQQKRLLEKVQDIDGRIIASGSHLASNEGSQREVNFKLSSSLDPESFAFKPKKSGHAGRKSCLKRSSFSSVSQEVQKKGPRKSKFDSMSRSSIDGKVIKSDRKKKQQSLEASKENIQQQSTNNHESENESEEGSQYNIFGSKKVVLNQELRQNLGLGSDSIMEDSESSRNNKSNKPARGHSILKKTSIIVVKKENTKNKSSLFKEEEQKQKPDRKAKKSVMFLG